MNPSKSLIARMLSLLAMALPSMAAASTLPVSPGSYPTIQSAIDAASNGDEVVVPPGEYNEQLRFNGKAITVRSTDGPEATFLYGSGDKGGVVSFDDEEGRDSVLDGFTISSSEVAAPIMIDYAAPTVRNCIIESNDGFYAGGILITDDSDPLIEQCTIRDNTGNQSGAILVEESHATIRRCQILDNYGAGTGGIRIDDGSADITNCLIAYNTTDTEGEEAGGITVRSSDQTWISNCTIVNNSTTYGTYGGVALFYGSTYVSNSIVWGNSPSGIGQVEWDRGYIVQIDFSDIQDGWGGPGTGNIIATPNFRDPEADFHLAAGSPCIDAGSNTRVPEGTSDDLDGHARFLDDAAAADCAQSPGACGDAPIVDMGAYERCGAGHLIFLSTPCHARAGETLLPTVAVVNQCGDIDTEAFGEVELTLSSNPTDADLNGNRIVELNEGVAAWSHDDELNITVAGCGYRLLATYKPGEGQPELPGGYTVESDSFKIKPGCMDHLTFCPQPENTPAGAAILTEVSIRDTYENIVRIDDLLVVLSLGQNPAEATLGGQFFALTCNGVATWSSDENLNITRAAAGYTLVAELLEGPEVTRGGLSGESEPFDILGGDPHSIAFLHQPADTTAGVPIATTVELRDEFGNRSSGTELAVELLIDSNPGAATLGGTTTLTSNGGVAVWTSDKNLNITVADAGYTLRAQAVTGGVPLISSEPPSMGEAVSSTFRILPGAPARLAFTAQPSDALANAAIGPPILVAILDAFGNAVSSATNHVSLAIGTNPAGGTLAGGSAVAASNGMAAFAAVSISTAGNGYTLIANSPELQSASSVGFNVVSDAPAPNPNPGLPPIDLIGNGDAQDVLLGLLFRNALCGLGAVGMVPATLLGLVGMKRRNRRR